MQSLTAREQLFVALGAAIGSNCVPCIEKIIPKAQVAGIEDWELSLAMNVADMVRQKPAQFVLAAGRALVQGEAAEAPREGECPLSKIGEETQEEVVEAGN